MLHWPKNDRPDIAELRRSAHRLGLDVGENNHMDTVGWVRAELTSVLNIAMKAGVIQEIRSAYERGKQEGRARGRPQGGGCGAARLTGTARAARADADRPQADVAPTHDDAEGFTERISPEEGLRSTIGVMLFVADDPQARMDLNGLFAGMFDMQERILNVVPEKAMKDTFRKCLKLLYEAGWVEDCRLVSFDDTKAVLVLRSTTAIAKAFGYSSEPLCQPICNLLETIGRKTFGVSVVVMEVECSAQGKAACRFEITPRGRASAADEWSAERESVVAHS